MTETLQGQYLGTVRMLASAAANRDESTLGHSVRVGRLAVMIGRHFRLEDRALAQVEIGGYLHDVGRIGIRDSIRSKLDALTDKQRHLLDSHPHIDVESRNLNQLQAPPLFAPSGAAELPKHSEALADGEGAMVARIVEVADLYDALTVSERRSEAFTPHQALSLLRTQVGAVLSIGMLEALAAVVPEWERQRLADPELGGDRAQTAPKKEW
jgi:HD-GYP domain-containing protein (c-di-GMP phosphodiesterase class II)